MLKKRLIFILYYDSGHFYLSRNFRLQRVGDARWLVDKFRFKAIGRFIDELVILDVSRQGVPRCAGEIFAQAVGDLMRQTLVPLTMGGGLASMADAERCFQLGADKILFNSAVLADPDLITQCVARFGAQAVIGALDVWPEAQGRYVTKVGNGQQPGLDLAEHLRRAAALGVGEVLVNSIERDGTGMGFDLALIDHCLGLQMPLIVAGGAGKPEHFGQVLRLSDVQAAATGNLFNFIGKGFEQVRHFLLEQQLPVRSAVVSIPPLEKVEAP